MNGARFPEGFHIARLERRHPRSDFHCGKGEVDDWLATRALQHQEKKLSVTRVLLDRAETIAGFYTLASGQIDFSDLPPDIVKHLPKRELPVAVLAWLGVNSAHQGRGLGGLLLAQALRDCYEAGKTFAFIAVILDCLDDAAKSFYLKWDFQELPSYPYRMILSANKLEAMMEG
ncbi:MAG: GNAT family N-acetyltransferase [Pirellulales bacterium]|nr:GNAT family N-acetyltransferase [Pirellulales bacterium]